MARLLALVAALAPALVGISGVDAEARPWLTIAAGLGLGLLVYARTRRAAALVALASVLATVAGLFAYEGARRENARSAAADAPHVDLTQDALTEPIPEWIEVRGFFHQGWILDEYAVADGQRPDQSKAASAVLVPFVGHDEDVVSLDGAIVIARVEPARAGLVGPQTIRGRTRPVPADILAVLVQVAGVDDASRVHGIILDTLDAEPASRPWIHMGLALVAALAALVLYSRATMRPR